MEDIQMRSKKLPLYVAGGAGISALAAVLGVSLSGSGSAASAVTAEPKSTVVQIRATPLGRVLVDVQGRTLYLFAKDSGPKSSCIGSCTVDWPPVPVTGAPKAGAGVAATALGSIGRTGGPRQLTYAGHPLYYFDGDHKAGQTNGQAVDEFGAKWFALTPGGHPVPASAGRAHTGSSSGCGGYGY
jgi:predicted lipoprotein with Yx(FWY)xxD motif